MFRQLVSWKPALVTVIQAYCIGHCTFEYVADFVTTSGPSMEPTLRTSDLLVCERLSKRMDNYERGDIVIAKNPINPRMMICKRIVGLPGDKIHVKPKVNPFGSSKSELDVNDKTLRDSLAYFVEDEDDHIDNQSSSMKTFRSKTVIVPVGHVWIEGDNSENSIDSRSYGPIPMGLIQSRAAIRFYPDFAVF